ncbi:MAG TPA: hypothetical protein VFL86_12885 [Burkholderiaceae bacterium]|nr:hypothetical protein [Burkholderiaceae bacterium]
MTQLHLGGGTPTFLASQDLHRLLAAQRAVSRLQPHETVAQALARTHEPGFASVNADLIGGLHCQTPAGFAHTVQALAGGSCPWPAAWRWPETTWHAAPSWRHC